MHRSLLILLCLLGSAAGLRADLPVPPQVLDPQTPAEAWNVIRLATANVARLLKEERLQEVPAQISLCSPALHALARFVAVAPEKRPKFDDDTALAFRLVNDVAQAAMASLPQNVAPAFGRLQATLDSLKPAFPAEEVAAEIYACPRHPEVLGTRADVPCRLCSGALRIRRIPYTELFVPATSSQSRLTVESKTEPAAGVQNTFHAKLTIADGSPLPVSKLIPLHSAAVRFFAVDAKLEDFHVMTPTPMSEPGTFTAAFTPAVAGPHRIWAEIVPEDTALPEHPFDLGGDFQMPDRSKHDFIDALGASSGDLRFQLTFGGGNGGSPPLRQVTLMRLHVTTAAGSPVTRLEPFMNAFAHLTCLYDDGKTLLRLHPVGGDILRDDVRGGPWLAFKIYPPQTGFLRIFGQVKIDGRVVTVPFGVHITK